ncbi:hypothetical protein ACHHRT_12765 [Desulfurivibrio sp. D14AmB]|uniref:hypothetical protein n=1 Tax=Desulfurivibrio sp. D14AmB TaxID=3374370 RepID=UPI00376F15CC
MARDVSSGRGSDTNAPIVTTDQASRPIRPQNLLDAISDIQQFYVIESKGQDIPGEFLTIGRTVDFFKIGAKSGFAEGLILILLMPFFAFYLNPFVLKAPDLFTRSLFSTLPYIMVIVNTLLCSYIGRYYIGKITRKAINSLLTGRTMSLLLKAFLIYVFYLLLHRVSTPHRVWAAAKHFGSLSESLYYGYLKILPQMVPVATEIAVIMAIAAIMPYGMVYFQDAWTRWKAKRNLRTISAK